MARVARVVVPGCVYHVTQQGNQRETVFLENEDRKVYQSVLREYLLLHSVRLVGHCDHSRGAEDEPALRRYE